jgi:hypothetical protein
MISSAKNWVNRVSIENFSNLMLCKIKSYSEIAINRQIHILKIVKQ